jgi:hypothetical protein
MSGLPLVALLAMASLPPLTLPSQQWQFSLDVGGAALDWPYLFAGYGFRGDLRADPEVAVGLTDRLEARLLLPALAYRFGGASGPQVVIYGGSLGLSVLDEQFSLQAPQDAVPLLVSGAEIPVTLRATVGLGAALRLPTVPTRAWDFSLEVNFTTPVRPQNFDFPVYTLDVAAGYALEVSPRLRLHPAVALTNSVAEVPGVFTSPLKAALGLGGVQRVGLRRTPLLQWGITDRLYLDVDAAVWAGLEGSAEALVGFTWTP